MDQTIQVRLRAWLQAQGWISSSDLSVKSLTGGQSNPTFLLTAGTEQFVLRKKPDGVLQKSAHAIDREYRVISALKDTAVPVPTALAWCDDESIVGTPFYLMSFLDGRVFVDQSLPGMSPAERAAIYLEMNRVISELHKIDIDAKGLGDYGKREDYLSRQINRWSSQLSTATIPVPDGLQRLMQWLPAHLPAPQRMRYAPAHAVIRKICDGIPNRRQLPVKHADHSWLCRVKNQIIETEVTVNQRRALRRGQMHWQPLRQSLQTIGHRDRCGAELR